MRGGEELWYDCPRLGIPWEALELYDALYLPTKSTPPLLVVVEGGKLLRPMLCCYQLRVVSECVQTRVHIAYVWMPGGRVRLVV